MAWLGGQRSVKPSTPSLAEDEDTTRPSTVSLYDESPSGEITIEEFELCALDRLQGLFSCLARGTGCAPLYSIQALLTAALPTVLKGLEDAKARGKKGDDLQVRLSAFSIHHCLHLCVTCSLMLAGDCRHWLETYAVITWEHPHGRQPSARTWSATGSCAWRSAAQRTCGAGSCSKSATCSATASGKSCPRSRRAFDACLISH